MNTKEIVKKILLTPIECNKRYKTIKLVNGEICSPQKYYCGEDCDMSDFAVGFYEIIYANILSLKISNTTYSSFSGRDKSAWLTSTSLGFEPFAPDIIPLASI